MRNFTWNRFPIKNLLIDSLLTHIVESIYLNRDMCKFESSQKDDSRWQSTDSSKAYRNTSAFKWTFVSVTLGNLSSLTFQQEMIMAIQNGCSTLTWIPTLRSDSRSVASLRLITQSFRSECNLSRPASLKFPFAFILVGTVVALWR